MSERKKILMLGYLVLKNDPRVLREAKALSEAGYQMEVICLRDGEAAETKILSDNLIEHQVSTGKYRGGSFRLYIQSYASFAFRAFWKVLRLCLKNDYAAVHVHTIPDLLVFCALPAKMFGAAIILDMHDTVPELYQDKFGYNKQHWLIRGLTFCERISTRMADEIITVNEPHCELVRDRCNLRKRPAVIFNAVDDSIFHTKASRTKAPLKNLIVHGTLAHRHGVDILLDAMPHVLRVAPETILRIYGSGDATPELMKKIELLELGSHVYLSNQYHPLEDMAEFVREADLGVIPYRMTESTQFMLPTKLMEYLACGLAVVTADTKPVRRLCDQGVDLETWSSEDPLDLAKLIVAQIQNPSLADLPDKLRWEEHSKVLLKLYAQCIGKAEHSATADSSIQSTEYAL